MEACHWLEMTSSILPGLRQEKSGGKYMSSVEKGDARADIA